MDLSEALCSRRGPRNHRVCGQPEGARIHGPNKRHWSNEFHRWVANHPFDPLEDVI